jgi:hypothetical protein
LYTHVGPIPSKEIKNVFILKWANLIWQSINWGLIDLLCASKIKVRWVCNEICFCLLLHTSQLKKINTTPCYLHAFISRYVLRYQYLLLNSTKKL